MSLLNKIESENSPTVSVDVPNITINQPVTNIPDVNSNTPSLLNPTPSIIDPTLNDFNVSPGQAPSIAPTNNYVPESVNTSPVINSEVFNPGQSILFSGPNLRQRVRARKFTLPEVRNNIAEQFIFQSQNDPSQEERRNNPVINYLQNLFRQEDRSFLNYANTAYKVSQGDIAALIGDPLDDLGRFIGFFTGLGADIGREAAAQTYAFNQVREQMDNGNFMGAFRNFLGMSVDNILPGDQSNLYNGPRSPRASRSGNIVSRARNEFYNLTEDGEYLPYAARALNGNPAAFTGFSHDATGRFNPFGVLGDIGTFTDKSRAEQIARTVFGLTLDMVTDPILGPFNDWAAALGRTVDVVPPVTILREGTETTTRLRNSIEFPSTRVYPDTYGPPRLPERPSLIPEVVRLDPVSPRPGSPLEYVTIDVPASRVTSDIDIPLPTRLGRREYTTPFKPLKLPKLLDFDVRPTATSFTVRPRQIVASVADSVFRPAKQFTDVVRALPAAGFTRIVPRTIDDLGRLVNTYNNVIAPTVQSFADIQTIARAIPDKQLSDVVNIVARPLGLPVPKQLSASTVSQIDTKLLVNQLDRIPGDFTKQLVQTIDRVQEVTSSGFPSVVEIPTTATSGPYTSAPASMTKEQVARLNQVVRDYNLPTNGTIIEQTGEFNSGIIRVPETNSIYKISDDLNSYGFTDEDLALVERQQVRQVDMIREINNMNKPYIVNYRQINTDFTHMEDTGGLSAHRYLVDLYNTVGLDPAEYTQEVQNVLQQVTDAVFDLANEGFVHTDLHGGNVHIMPDKSIKFIDLDMVTSLQYMDPQESLQHITADLSRFEPSLLDHNNIKRLIDDLLNPQTRRSLSAYEEVRQTLPDNLRVTHPTLEVRVSTDRYIQAKKLFDNPTQLVNDLENQLMGVREEFEDLYEQAVAVIDYDDIDVDELTETLSKLDVEGYTDLYEELDELLDIFVDNPTKSNLKKIQSQVEYTITTMLDEALGEAETSYNAYKKAELDLENAVAKAKSEQETIIVDYRNLFNIQRDLDLGFGNRSSCL